MDMGDGPQQTGHEILLQYHIEVPPGIAISVMCAGAWVYVEGGGGGVFSDRWHDGHGSGVALRQWEKNVRQEVRKKVSDQRFKTRPVRLV